MNTQAVLDHLANKLDELWEEVASPEFSEGLGVHVRFDDRTIRETNERLLASAKEHLKIVSVFKRDCDVDSAWMDRFVQPFLKEAREVVEAGYIEADEYYEGYR